MFWIIYGIKYNTSLCYYELFSELKRFFLKLFLEKKFDFTLITKTPISLKREKKIIFIYFLF